MRGQAVALWKMLRAIVLWAVIAAGALASGAPIRRLYVEPFATRSGAEPLREAVIAELGRQGSVGVAPSEDGADAVLGGGGEIWVRGYKSLNPRSGPRPSGGRPVYGGYLSVELRNRAGETVWSYLATPAPGAEDVARDLAKRIAGRLRAALADGIDAAPHAAAAGSGAAAASLHGAGATFPYPIYAKWFLNYRRTNPNAEIAYDAVGSEAGIRRLLAGEVDFGASDSPEAVRELAPGQEAKFRNFPTVVGAVVPIVNLPGVTAEIAFTPEILAGIYLGRIRKWNDPAIVRANPGVRMPDLDIVAVHRSDGSGTTYAWCDYLTRTNADWSAQVGASMSPKWPAGRGAAGNEGVAGLVKELGGAIGYVEYNYALRNHVSFGKVRNGRGEFVQASLESMATGAYPISSFTWIVLPSHIEDAAKREAIKNFLTWTLGPGQAQAAALGYLALPAEMASRELAAIAAIR